MVIGVVVLCFPKIDFGSLAVQTEWQHGIHLNCAIANSPMENFTPDTIKKYKEAHIAVCTHYGFETTNVVHIAIATPKEKQWHHLLRDEEYYRVNISMQSSVIERLESLSNKLPKTACAYPFKAAMLMHGLFQHLL